MTVLLEYLNWKVFRTVVTAITYIHSSMAWVKKADFKIRSSGRLTVIINIA